MQAHIGSAVQVVLSSDLKQPTSEFQVITHKHLPVLFQCCQPQTQQTTYEDTANFKPYSWNTYGICCCSWVRGSHLEILYWVRIPITEIM